MTEPEALTILCEIYMMRPDRENGATVFRFPFTMAIKQHETFREAVRVLDLDPAIFRFDP